MERDRMFRVIVLGGLSLVGPTACSSTVGSSDASDVTSEFPSELPVFIDVPIARDASDAPDMSFPTELPVFVDTGPEDAATDTVVETGFPLECPPGPGRLRRGVRRPQDRPEQLRPMRRDVCHLRGLPRGHLHPAFTRRRRHERLMSSTAPRDALDLRTLRDGARRAIAWDAPIDPALDDAQRTHLGRAWLHLARQEHLAVGAFALIARELAVVGCDSVVLSLITRASSDEVRHADLCRRMASRLLGPGEVPDVFRGVPSAPAHEGLSVRDRALLHVVEMCCLNETFTGVYLTEALARATDATMRSAIESLLEDEIDHGRVGWAHLAATVRDGWGASVVNHALPSIMERAVGGIFSAARRGRGPTDEVLTRHGHIEGDDAFEVYGRALDEVILPGFEAVSIETGSVRALAKRSGWVGA